MRRKCSSGSDLRPEDVLEDEEAVLREENRQLRRLGSHLIHRGIM